MKQKSLHLCEIYIDSPKKLYHEQLLLLDNLLYADKLYYKNEFSITYKENFLRNTEYLLNTLKVGNHVKEIKNIICMLENDMRRRNIKINIDDKD